MLTFNMKAWHLYTNTEATVPHASSALDVSFFIIVSSAATLPSPLLQFSLVNMGVLW